jgi:c-di-GMP-binding flagellar brake protein YcgR
MNMTQLEKDQENYDELKQEIFEYLQMLVYVKDDQEEYDFIQRRISFNINLMLSITKRNKK